MAGVAYSYLRFSSAEQAKGDSIRRQLEATRRYCAEHRLALDESLRDEGVSAFKSKNRTKGALAKFLAAVESGRIAPGSTLVVESFDRLSRAEILTALSLFTSIIQAGVRIVTLMDNKTYTAASVNANPFDLMYSLTVMARAHEESATKSKRVGEARARRRRAVLSGEQTPAAGRCPGWLKIEGGKFVPIPEHVATVKRIIQLGLDGMGAMSIARTLNREKVPVWRANNTKGWTFGTITYVMRSRTLLGEYEAKTITDGKPVTVGTAKGYYPAVVDEGTFYRLQAAMKLRRSTSKRGRVGKGIPNLFGDLLVSGNDGSRLWVVKKQENRLISRNAKDNGAKTPSFSLAAFERHFLEWVSEVQLTSPSNTAADRVGELKGRLAEIQAKIALLNGQMDAATVEQFPRLIEAMKRLNEQEERTASELRLAETTANAPEFNAADVRKLVERLDGLSEGDREQHRARLRQAIASVVRQIVLHVYRRGVRGQTTVGVCDVTLSDGGQRVFAIITKQGGISFSLSTGTALPDRTTLDAEHIAHRLLDVTADVPVTEFTGDDAPAIANARRAFAAAYVEAVAQAK